LLSKGSKQVDMCAIILMVIFGLIGLFVGEFKIIGNLKVEGKTARLLGLILLGGVGAFILLNAMGVATGTARGAERFSLLGNYVCLGAFVLTVIVGLAKSTTDEAEPVPEPKPEA
jgi:hypothetical protein